ncbi:hypothetical protein IC582_026480 [Cucumis melo]|uniref:YUP8H12R.23 protein n=1 Tax=Cucumis melo var. makuwa TaxID=1194695 RepID=A0A5D3CB81_CUCMM|nr:putative YUP8H12R.23 protein [Cucumis melo var. makuwa]TYK08600.1 putative YUP8H12R.23 protein [Cucumis melo var. makuwa]
MAAEVSSLVRVLTTYNKEDRHLTAGNESTAEKLAPLITRDLLNGGYSKFTESQELDLDLHVPSGWERRLDLKSGKMFIQRCNVQDFNNNNQTVPKLQDLNFPPSPNYSKFQLTNHLVDETSLDLKLVSSLSSSPSSSSPRSNYQSVCTLDKVKSALERAERNPIRKRSSLWKSSPSPSYSSSSSSAAADKEFREEEKLKCSSSPIAAGCPGCLSYVLVMKNNPTCPRCSSIVPLPAAKKPRIDLNISI